MRYSVFTFVIIIAIFMAPCAIGQDAPLQPVVLDDAEALALDARIYASDFGVSYDEALQRMTVMVYGANVAQNEAASEGQDLAGMYFDNSAAEFGLSIATRKFTKIDKAITFIARTRINFGQLNAQQRRMRNVERRASRLIAKLSDAEVSKAEDTLSKPINLRVKYLTRKKFSRADLEAGFKILAERGGTIPGFSAASIDEAENSLRLFVTADLPLAMLQDLMKAAGVPVVVDVIPGGFVPAANMRGGSKLYAGPPAPMPAASSIRYCMTAFGARSNTLKDAAGNAVTGVISAAHCPSSMLVIADDGKIKTLTTPPGHESDTRDGANVTEYSLLARGGWRSRGSGNLLL